MEAVQSILNRDILPLSDPQLWFCFVDRVTFSLIRYRLAACTLKFLSVSLIGGVVASIVRDSFQVLTGYPALMQASQLQVLANFCNRKRHDVGNGQTYDPKSPR